MSVRWVIADPRCRLPYYTYPLLGLMEAGYRLKFRPLDCPGSRGTGMLVDGARVWVHTDDNSDDTPEGPRAWADVVARVNARADDHDVLALGPLFGIRIWPLPAGYAKVGSLVRGGANARRSLQYVRFQGIARLGIGEYVPGSSDSTYVFGRGRDWRGPHEAVSEPRLRFAEALHGLPIETDVSVTDDRLDLRTYLRNTARSALVFNNPALHGCLGWKLGEFLALGKAILSTRLTNVLPAPLVHGEHVHYVADDVDAIRDAVELLLGDDGYRLQLERGARQWFDDNMSPHRVGTRILEAARAATR